MKTLGFVAWTILVFTVGAIAHENDIAQQLCQKRQRERMVQRNQLRGIEMTTTPPVTTITDELLAELEQLAGKVSAMALDSAEVITITNGAMIECPVCAGEGYASAENDYCNFDNHAIGVEFYGIGPEFGLAEAYFRAANPATILSLIKHIRALETELSIFKASDAQAIRWLAEIRSACGATHGMTFLEMVEHVRELRVGSARWRHARDIFTVEAIEYAQSEFLNFGLPPDESESVCADQAIDAARSSTNS